MVLEVGCLVVCLGTGVDLAPMGDVVDVGLLDEGLVGEGLLDEGLVGEGLVDEGLVDEGLVGMVMGGKERRVVDARAGIVTSGDGEAVDTTSGEGFADDIVSVVAVVSAVVKYFGVDLLW